MSRKPAQVLVIPYILQDEVIKYCIVRRSDMKCWQFVAGGIEENESLKDAAIRESKEEIGDNFFDDTLMVLDTTCSIPKYHFEGNEKWENIYVIKEYCFAVLMKSKNISLSDEHSTYKWVTYSEAIKHLAFDSNKTALWELKTRMEIKK